MFGKIYKLPRSSRSIHTTSPSRSLQQKRLPPSSSTRRKAISYRETDGAKRSSDTAAKENEPKYAKRNQVGVQLLSRKLHKQIFRNVSFPPPPAPYVRIARQHLEMHGLDPAQGSVLPDIGFTLPPLQGNNLDEHFHRIGDAASQPWLSLAKDFASAELPPRPEQWHIQAGWTRYDYYPDGSSSSTHVDFPELDGQPEQMLAFDVETLPQYTQYAVIACAASKNAWYSWVSPWLLGESDDPEQLIPMGHPSLQRVVVGHNVSFDRARILEEYNANATQTRFLDTMALHVAVKGISSHQRPAWMKYRKDKAEEKAQKQEAFETVVNLMKETEKKEKEEIDAMKKEALRQMRQDMEESLPQLLADDTEEVEAELQSKRWEDITSANSLADVAKLHCDIEMSKEIRSDFLDHSPQEILEDIQDYLNYCSYDVFVTHSVYAKVLPAFLTACPSPVSFAGILTMGSSFLTVNQEWERYIANAERTYKELEDKVKFRLHDLAREAKAMMEDESWKNDVWLSQLDWTPKVAGKSRGVYPPEVISENDTPEKLAPPQDMVPEWYRDILQHGPFYPTVVNRILPCLLELTFDGQPVAYSTDLGWHYVADEEAIRLPTAGTSKVVSVLSQKHALASLKNGRLSSRDTELATAIASGERSEALQSRVVSLARELSHTTAEDAENNPWLRQLSWKLFPLPVEGAPAKAPKKPKAVKPPKPPPVYWPKWYWELTKPKKDQPPGSLDLTVRNRFAPILLHLAWQGWPLFHSREHGWVFRVSSSSDFQTRATSLKFYDEADVTLQEQSLRGFVFYKLPHKDGEAANVGSPLGKTFIKYAQDGTLTSPGDEAKDALDMNAQCSYWISARDRVMNQMVVWGNGKDIGIRKPTDPSEKWGIIVPQVIAMGTVTRRAIEKTWLTASNAKKNRVGSELKAMVRAPDGYAIVGADVDSEELWISSVMGDAQFGLHGATALGWMTLEGTKAAGTDLHSKTASILGISRDQAKVFNYSRIYGAGMRHAVLLLLQSNAGMLQEEAQKLAENLYSSTKGRSTHRTDIFGRKFWFGGTESLVFNKLEEIALSDRPQTPALGCGVTYALSKEYLPAEFGSDYMTSRINWVVQSSGVDYLHLLIVAMQHLIKKYDIHARYLISVHDEVRYLVKEEDKYRAALALQIANLWTRSMFAFKLGMDDLPQGVAFFAAVDVDKVLRKEVDMPCITPSHPDPIPPGESLDIGKVLEKTSGSLWPDGSPMAEDDGLDCGGTLEGYRKPDCLVHRANSAAWLRAQVTDDFAEVVHLAQKESGQKISMRGLKGLKAKHKPSQDGSKKGRKTKLGNGDGVDWSETADELIKAGGQTA
ncbi:hypothetical protein NM688_g630 [Phlebia brevispora]|uniref:Uncharacterized protein n=1 Tax=Phlebia brevispora TaxID=194682 RepID=A0ACC1TEK2_9APHY|nr:hypothetical protein NM688_g630 [Phlebia brevispora]